MNSQLIAEWTVLGCCGDRDTGLQQLTGTSSARWLFWARGFTNRLSSALWAETTPPATHSSCFVYTTQPLLNQRLFLEPSTHTVKACLCPKTVNCRVENCPCECEGPEDQPLIMGLTKKKLGHQLNLWDSREGDPGPSGWGCSDGSVPGADRSPALLQDGGAKLQLFLKHVANPILLSLGRKARKR